MRNIDIDNLSEKELIELNRQIIARLKLLESMQINDGMMRLNLGEKVNFESHGEILSGTLIKFNQKTVSVITEAGEKWNISPWMLNRVNETNTEPGNSENVIQLYPSS